MEKVIKFEDIRKFAYINDAVCKKPIKGIAISFLWLGDTRMYDKEFEEAEFFGEKGILYVVPYNNPWAWMNKQAVAFTDEIIDVIMEEYKLDENIPIVSSGFSMGGQSALVYTAYAKRTPVSCVTNCPVCDMVYHWTERHDLPRTIYSALYNEEGTLTDALKRVSPLHLADKMPDIEYHIIHCDEDKAVNLEAHSEKFIKELEKRNYKVTLDISKGRGHCDWTLDCKRKYMDYIANGICK